MEISANITCTSLYIYKSIINTKRRHFYNHTIKHKHVVNVVKEGLQMGCPPAGKMSENLLVIISFLGNITGRLYIVLSTALK